MTKQIKKTPVAKTSGTGFLSDFSFSNIIPEKFQDIFFIIAPLLLLFFFFSGVLFGDKAFISGDIQASKAMENYLAHAKEVGSFPLWTPYLFLGMPSYIVEINLRWFDLSLSVIYYLQQILVGITNNKVAGPMFYFYILSIATYFFLRSKKVERLLAFLGGLAATFSTGMIIFLAIGHNTKMLTLCMIPVVLMIMEKYREKFEWIYFPILIIAFHIQFLSAHIQEIFYSFLMLLVYFAVFFIINLYKKNFNEFFRLAKTSIVLIFAGVLAAGMSIDQYWSIYEYNKYSIRGTQSIVKPDESTKKASGTGLDYDYATNWSFSPGEMLTFIIPSYFGYGNSTYKGELSNNQPVEVNTYWGQMPFVDVPQYMGVLIFMFALFGIYYRWKDPFVKFLTILSVFSVLVSFGRTFPVVFDLMFYYFPSFDKFRVPSMILNLVQIAFPILAMMGISYIVASKEENKPVKDSFIKYSLFGFAGLFLMSLILRGSLESWYTTKIASTQKVQQELFSYAYEMFANDFILSATIGLLGIGLLYAFLKNKINKDLLFISLIILIGFDLFRVSSRGMKMYDKESINQTFVTPDYVSEIKKDTDLYRIINVKQKGIGSVNENSNYYSSFLLQDFYGYSAAKPRTYQDLMEVVGPYNPTLWRMFNVKYVINDGPVNDSTFSTIYQGKEEAVLLNKSALPRAYFVNRYEVKPMLEVLTMIKENKFDPKDIMFFEPEQNIKIGKIDPPTGDSKIGVVKYLYENIELKVNATGNHLMFFGDTYCPTGWNAYIDGKQAEILRANHAGRAIIVPPGIHKVEFIYEPKSFYLGKNISLILNILVIGFLIGFVVYKKKK